MQMETICYRYGFQTRIDEPNPSCYNNRYCLFSAWHPLRDPSDDQVLCPYSHTAEPVYHDRDENVDAHAVILYYDVAAEHSTVTIWRAQALTETLGTPLAENTPATGIYSATTAALNTTYFYWLEAFDAEGHGSCVRGPAEVTRTADPIDPEGVVRINDGAAATNNVNVDFNINVTADMVEMQVRNDLDFDEDPNSDAWEPYVAGKPWTLTPKNDLGEVFVLFKDAAGNVSEPETDTIQMTEQFTGTLYLPRLGRAEAEQ
jgi:hypothetical protein